MRERGIDAIEGVLEHRRARARELRLRGLPALARAHARSARGPARDRRGAAPGRARPGQRPELRLMAAPPVRRHWYHLDLPRHRIHFTRPSLERALAARLRGRPLGRSSSAVGLPASLQYRARGPLPVPGWPRLRVASRLCVLTLPLTALLDRVRARATRSTRSPTGPAPEPRAAERHRPRHRTAPAGGERADGDPRWRALPRPGDRQRARPDAPRPRAPDRGRRLLRRYRGDHRGLRAARARARAARPLARWRGAVPRAQPRARRRPRSTRLLARPGRPLAPREARAAGRVDGGTARGRPDLHPPRALRLAYGRRARGDRQPSRPRGRRAPPNCSRSAASSAR